MRERETNDHVHLVKAPHDGKRWPCLCNFESHPGTVWSLTIAATWLWLHMPIFAYLLFDIIESFWYYSLLIFGYKWPKSKKWKVEYEYDGSDIDSCDSICRNMLAKWSVQVIVCPSIMAVLQEKRHLHGSLGFPYCIHFWKFDPIAEKESLEPFEITSIPAPHVLTYTFLPVKCPSVDYYFIS